MSCEIKESGWQNEKNTVLHLSGIIKESIVDGPGIRYVVFAQGCPHDCAGCHNPETHPFSGGYEKSVAEILAEIEVNPLLKGITLSGGEPFCQPCAMAALAKGARAQGLEVAAYTGYTFEELIVMPQAAQLLATCDTVIDGRFEIGEKSPEERFRGSYNQRIIDVAKSLLQGEAVCDKSHRWNG